MTKILTTRLARTNRLVLAKQWPGYGLQPVTYANRSQAEKKIEDLQRDGVDCFLTGDRPYYVTFDHEPTFTE